MSEMQSMCTISTAKPNKHSNNEIRNTKYTLITFLPYVLLQQFQSASSVFFFCIMLLQLRSDFAITSFAASFFPWAFVFLLSLVNEGVDDYKRYLRDVKSNSSECFRWSNSSFESVTSASIKSGDVILIRKGERVPADCIILKVDDSSGEVFIRTDQLDGETDWKRRVAVPESQHCHADVLTDIRIVAESPHKDIYSFTAVIDLPTRKGGTTNIFKNHSQRIDQTGDQINQRIDQINQTGDQTTDQNMHRTDQTDQHTRVTDHQSLVSDRISVGVDLENTIWANTVVATSDTIGAVIYTGNDTRSMMNTYKPRSKTGSMESEVDYAIFWLAFFSLIISFYFTVMCAYDMSYNTVVIFVRFIMLFSYVIPISLKVTINLARIWYVRLVQSSTLKGVIVRTSSIQEELGRVSYLLTDKTGTLTRNEMVMKKLHIDTVFYAAENTKEIKEKIEKAMKEREEKRKGKRSKNQDRRIYELVEALALCHSVMPVETESGTVYQASSPDELAMVQYAETIGLRLAKRDRARIVLDTPVGEREYRILETFPFNSDTKRMGIILERVVHEPEKIHEPVRVTHEPEIFFLEKGADAVMSKILKPNFWAADETDNMARDGLRTLLVGMKRLTREEYEEFAAAYGEAKRSVVGRSERMLECQQSIETGLDILGLTGVEDRLQERVKQSLENLRNAGIKIWMLTGDKVETAISIALSSRLLDKTDQYLVISGCRTPREIEIHLKALRTQLTPYTALIIDGVSLAVVLETCLPEFIGAVRNLHCVVGCRCTPTQKALMAAALKRLAGETVCCIGDGGNDVSMITEANVGIGIEGKEGNQASLAADFSIQNFADICDLFFWHGRRCYQNSASVAHMIIHRGTIISIVQAIFCALIQFIPISIFQGKMAILFIFYTFFPLFAIINSEDISRLTAIRFPELYYELGQSRLLSPYSFLLYNFNSLFQGAVIVMSYCHFIKDITPLRMLVFTTLILNEQAMVFLSLERLDRVVFFMTALSLFCYAISFFIFPGDLDFKAHYGNSFKLCITLVATLVVVIAWRVYTWWLYPASYRKLRIAS